MFPTLIVYQGYQNQPHHVDLACCQQCHERAVCLGDECQEPLKTTGSSNISMYTQGIYMVYTWYIQGIYMVYTIHIVSSLAAAVSSLAPSPLQLQQSWIWLC